MSEEEKLPVIQKQSRENQGQSQEKDQLLATKSSKARYNSISIVKKARRQVEEDARLLQNRIALLKQEEIRNYKKIDEIKKKAIEIYTQKTEIERRQKKKEQLVQKDLALKREKAKVQRDQNLAEKLNKKELFDMQKILRRQEIQQQKAKNKLKREYFEKKVREQKQIRNQLIKQQEQSGREKLQQFHDQKQQYFREMHELSINEEDYARQKKQKEIKQMEKIENQLITKLQQSQAFQKQAFQELEQALLLPPKEFADKFLQPSEQVSKIIKEEDIEDKKVKIQQPDQKTEISANIQQKQQQQLQYQVKIVNCTLEEPFESNPLLIQINDFKTNTVQAAKTMTWNSELIKLLMNQKDFEIKLLSAVEGGEQEIGKGAVSIKDDEKIKESLSIMSAIANTEGKNIASIQMEVTLVQN